MSLLLQAGRGVVMALIAELERLRNGALAPPQQEQEQEQEGQGQAESRHSPEQVTFGTVYDLRQRQLPSTAPASAVQRSSRRSLGHRTSLLRGRSGPRGGGGPASTCSEAPSAALGESHARLTIS